MNHREHVLLLALAWAPALTSLRGMVVPAAFAASTAQRKLVLPDPQEFREGDNWDALATSAGASDVSVAYVKRDGKFVQAEKGVDAYLSGSTPGKRAFTDLGGALPKFPAASGDTVFAAADGTLYASERGSWVRKPIGSGISTPSGAFIVSERMTPADADALYQRMHQPTIALPTTSSQTAGNPSASTPTVDSALRDQIALGRAPSTHAPTAAELQDRADQSALDGDNGMLVRLAVAWRLHRYAVVGEILGYWLGGAAVIGGLLFILTRKRTAR